MIVKNLTVEVSLATKEKAPAKRTARAGALYNTNPILPQIAIPTPTMSICNHTLVECGWIINALLTKGVMSRDYAVNHLGIRDAVVTRRIRACEPVLLSQYGFRVERIANGSRHIIWRLVHNTKGAA